MKIFIRAILVLGIFLFALFGAAGRWDWMPGWLYLVVVTLGSAVNDFLLWRKNPELMKIRGTLGFGEGTKDWDKLFLYLFVAGSVLIMITGALDNGRYQWSYMPPSCWFFGVVLYAVGQSLITWSMLVNPFFEKSVRIQKDRGHKVIDKGPYRYVRHPGYTGTIIGLMVGSPFLLGSWWAFIPALITGAGFVVRTQLEDKLLKEELDGYAEYSMRVRYKLVPFVW